jgi:hypothetical protein
MTPRVFRKIIIPSMEDRIMKVERIWVLVLLISLVPSEIWAGCVCSNSSVSRSPINMSFQTIGLIGEGENPAGRVGEKAWDATIGIGVLYDSRIGADISTGGSGISDAGAVLRMGAGYVLPFTGPFGIRADYSGAARAYDTYETFNLVDQTVSLSPYYAFKRAVLSLPVSVSSVMEDNRRDAFLYTLTPAFTWLISDNAQAMAVYGIFSKIEDQNSGLANGDEDGKVLGAGCSYAFSLDFMNHLRLSLEYTETTYDVPVYYYPTSIWTYDDREDYAVTAGLEYEYKITPSVGLYTHYTYIYSTSNIDMNDYNRNIVEAGISFKY